MADRARVLALDISGSRTRLAVIAADGEMGLRSEVRNRTGQAASYWPAIRAAAGQLTNDTTAVGISFGGPVDKSGRILSIHVEGWAGIDPAAELRQALGRPVVIENDANCGAVGEAEFGHWGATDTLVFLTCSTGIGGGIYSGRKLHRGARGLAGELGHICVDPGGLSCPCGSRGCLEAMCSGTAIARRASAALAASRESHSLLANLVVGGEVPEAKPVFDAAAAGDALAREILAAVFADFGRGIAAIHNALDPDLIVIGGGVALAGDRLSQPVAAAARPWLMAHRREHLRLETASLGLDSQLYGAAALALQA